MAQKSLDRLKDEVEYFEYQLEFCNLKLDGGLEIEHKKMVRDYKNAKRENEESLKMSETSIEILEDQIKRGVEIKKVEPVDAESEGGKE